MSAAIQNAFQDDGLAEIMRLRLVGDPDPFEEEEEDYSAWEAAPLSEEEIKSAISQEIWDASGDYGDDIADQREKALNYYFGKPFGNEQEGRSSVILTDVADTVEWIMPQLMRMFAAGPEVCRYEPRKRGKEDEAEAATRYLNNRFMKRLDGFRVLHDGFKTALIEKTGIWKVWSETRVEPKLETYNGLDEFEVAELVGEPGVTVVSHNEYDQHIGTDEETGQEVVARLFDLRVRRTEPRTEIKVAAIPPEEFMVSRRATKLDDAPFLAWRRKLLASDLIAMGFDRDIVYSLPFDDTPEWSRGRTVRYDEDSTYPFADNNRPDPASREVWVTECYIRLDEDGDGYSELRKITVVGDASIEILEDVEVAYHPFALVCPVPIPHKLVGMSLADLVMDLQLIRSTLLRQMLDNLYFTNNSRTAVWDGEVEVDDMLESRPGGVVRTYQKPSEVMMPLVTQPLSPMAYNVLEYLEEVRQNRTGITRYTQGMDATSLNQTAHGIERIMSAAGMRIELIAQIFAQGGLKELFQLLLQVYKDSGIKEDIYRSEGEWVSASPSVWDSDMDVTVNVGLGIGKATERLNNLQLIAGLQEKLQEYGLGMGYMVTAKNIYEVVKQISETVGFCAEGQFFQPPQGPPPDPEPTPEEIKVANEGERMKAEAMIKVKQLQLDMEKERNLVAHRKAELESKERIAMAEIASKETIALAQIQAKEEEPAQAA